METLLEQQRRYHEERERLLDALVQVQYSTVQYSAVVQYSTVQYSIVHVIPRVGTVQYSTI